MGYRGKTKLVNCNFIFTLPQTATRMLILEEKIIVEKAYVQTCLDLAIFIYVVAKSPLIGGNEDPI